MHSPRIDDIIASHVTFCGRGLGLERGVSALLSNGRVSSELCSSLSVQLKCSVCIRWSTPPTKIMTALC